MNDAFLLGIARALYMNRLHLLRLTEVVRLGIRPDPTENNALILPDELDNEMQQRAIDFVLAVFPKEQQDFLNTRRSDWTQFQ